MTTTLTRGPLLLASSLALLLAACGGSDTSPPGAADRLEVAASFQPIDEIVRKVGADRVSVLALTNPGAEAHDAQLTAKLLERVANADAIFYLGQGFQAGVEDGIATLDDSVKRVDLLEGLTLLQPTEHANEGDDGDESSDHADHEEGLAGGKDPHVWLSPLNVIAMTEATAEALSSIDPDHAGEYSSNASAYIAELTELDTEMATTLATCANSTFVTSHEAFGYLADRYGLTQLPISGLSPEDEPSAKQLEDIAAEAQQAGASVIFVEDELAAGLAETLAQELGLTTVVLMTFESLTSEQLAAEVTYASVQRDNLAALSTALDCST
jgi:zinc transport system substrate-binding protein